ncbi:MAG: hypothetical protein M1166_02755 [Candidatus Thermoplasmatota archaeon]|nr:hypothetical protein [Candidatus Thermoplasmatota archaeon]
MVYFEIRLFAVRGQIPPYTQRDNYSHSGEKLRDIRHLPPHLIFVSNYTLFPQNEIMDRSVLVPVKYVISFHEVGLPNGTLWAVTLDNTRLSSVTDYVNFRSMTAFFKVVLDYLKPDGRKLIIYGDSGDMNYFRSLMDSLNCSKTLVTSRYIERYGRK